MVQNRTVNEVVNLWYGPTTLEVPRKVRDFLDVEVFTSDLTSSYTVLPNLFS